MTMRALQLTSLLAGLVAVSGQICNTAEFTTPSGDIVQGDRNLGSKGYVMEYHLATPGGKKNIVARGVDVFNGKKHGSVKVSEAFEKNGRTYRERLTYNTAIADGQTNPKVVVDYSGTQAMFEPRNCSVRSIHDWEVYPFGFYFKDPQDKVERYVETADRLFDTTKFNIRKADDVMFPINETSFILAHKYETCTRFTRNTDQYTCKIEWYWSQKSQWNEHGEDNFPLMMTRRCGETQDEVTTLNVDIVVDTIAPFTDNEKALLSVSRGVFCEGMTDQRPVATFPLAFKISTEAVETEHKHVENIEEFYNFKHNITRQQVMMTRRTGPNGEPAPADGSVPPHIYELIHNYKTGVGYRLDVNQGSCATFNISESTWLFPGPNHTPGDDRPNMPPLTTPASLFNLDKINAQYYGSGYTCRHMNCHYWVGLRTEATTTYGKLFETVEILATTKSWNDFAEVPTSDDQHYIAEIVTRRYNESDGNTLIGNKYTSVFNFAKLDDDQTAIFLEPSVAYCNSTNNTVKVSKKFSFEGELVDDMTHKVEHVSGKYHFGWEVFAYTYKPSVAYQHELTGAVRIIHDYSTGIAYKEDPERNTCTKDVLRPDSPLDVDHEGMMTPQELLGLSTQNGEYSGKRPCRNMECDTWTLKEFRDSVGNNPAKWFDNTYRYSADNWYMDMGNQPLNLKTNIIVQVTKDVFLADGQGRPTTVQTDKRTMNVFNWIDQDKEYLEFQMASCMTDLKFQWFQMKFSSNVSVETNRHVISEQIHNSIRHAMGNITPLRISAIGIKTTNKEKTKFTVDFGVWDRDSLDTNANSPDLKQAEANLKKVQKDQTFSNLVFSVTDLDSTTAGEGTITIELKADKSLKKCGEICSKDSSTDVAAIIITAICCFLGGIVLVVGWLWIRKGWKVEEVPAQMFGTEKVILSNDPVTFSNPIHVQDA